MAWPGSIRVPDLMYHVFAYLSTAKCVAHRRVSKAAREFIDRQYLVLLETLDVDAKRMTGVPLTATTDGWHCIVADKHLEWLLSKCNPRMATLALSNAGFVDRRTIGYALRMYMIDVCACCLPHPHRGIPGMGRIITQRMPHVRQLHLNTPGDISGVRDSICSYVYTCMCTHPITDLQPATLRALESLSLVEYDMHSDADKRLGTLESVEGLVSLSLNEVGGSLDSWLLTSFATGVRQSMTELGMSCVTCVWCAMLMLIVVARRAAIMRHTTRCNRCIGPESLPKSTQTRPIQQLVRREHGAVLAVRRRRPSKTTRAVSRWQFRPDR
jgi:hypothetical protein